MARNQKPGKLPYTRPTLRKYQLTEDEIAVLRETEDPMTKLKELKPNLFKGLD